MTRQRASPAGIPESGAAVAVEAESASYMAFARPRQAARSKPHRNGACVIESSRSSVRPHAASERPDAAHRGGATISH